MPRLIANGFEAWITIEGEEVEQYEPKTVEYPTGQTCWIASQINKGFSIHWKNTDVFCQTVARIWVDGIECSGEIILMPNREATISGRRASGSTVSPFVFSPLNLTGTVYLIDSAYNEPRSSPDDDAFLDSAAHKDVGIIRVEIWTINYTGSKPYRDNAPPPVESKIHERSKKGGAHQIKFQDSVVVSTRAAAIIEYLENSPLVTFTFRYKSLDLLKADGLAPSHSSSKRKALTGSPSSSQIKGPKRVKTEPKPQVESAPGEIIDLTRSESPVATEVIDLT
ncbi:hypothetical protein DFH06DRAFT_1077812 [Mycena polygramma]|nr:hypothetical protein DFH06DRAFT_1077812 [Mycena polygramma]